MGFGIPYTVVRPVVSTLLRRHGRGSTALDKGLVLALQGAVGPRRRPWEQADDLGWKLGYGERGAAGGRTRAGHGDAMFWLLSS